MAYLKRVQEKLESVIKYAEDTELNIFIMRSCTNLQMPAAQVRIAISHISLDLRHESLCLAFSKKGEKI